MATIGNDLTIEYVGIDTLIPYEGNAKEHPEEQIAQIRKSIEEFGFADPIAIDENNIIIEGHGRLYAAQDMGLELVPVIRLNGFTDEQRKAYTIIHNKLTMDTGFDLDKLNRELASIPDIDMGDFGFAKEFLDKDDDEDDDGLDDGYSKSVGKVVYEPKDTDWTVPDLYVQTDRFDDMIEALDVDEDIKQMFRIRAHWFCEFNFAHIADYYAFQATPEVQRVMEALGMVLLDKDQLIENGFAEIIESI